MLGPYLHRLAIHVFCLAALALPACTAEPIGVNLERAPGSKDAETGDDPNADDPNADDPSGDAPSVNPACTDAARHDAALKALEKELAAGGASGGAVGIVCNGKFVFAGGVGSTSAGGPKIDAHTRFNIASVTKMMTAVTALRLAARGSFRLDAPPAPLVTASNTQRPFARSFTWAELLSHTAGVPTWSEHASADLEQFVVLNASAPLWSTPGALWLYSNVGYAHAGYALEKTAGVPFGKLVEQEIFATVGMKDSSMDAAAVEATGNFAKGSGKNLPTSGYLGTTYYGPMGGAWSSATDMAMFAEALLKGGSGKLLDAASHAEWSKARAQTDGGPKDSWGLGVNISERDNGDVVWTHTGSVDGYRAELFMTPKTKFAVVILVSENFAPYQYAGEMHELFTGKKVGQPVFAPFSAADVPGQLGKYDSTTMGELVVSQGAGATLTLKVGTNSYALKGTGERDAYSFDDAGGPNKLNFRRNAAGAIEYLSSFTFIGRRK